MIYVITGNNMYNVIDLCFIVSILSSNMAVVWVLIEQSATLLKIVLI